jgi:seryl-tRNA synthetase
MWWENTQFLNINSKLDRLTRLVLQLLQQENQMAIDLTAATAELAKNNDVTASAVQAINTLIAQVAAVTASDPAAQAQLDNIVANWRANDATIAAAIANSPQSPTEVPAVVVVPPAAPQAARGR